MFSRFIDRPVLSTVISILLVLLGVLGLLTLPISQYPEIAPPTVVVNASYQGASAEVLLNSVVVPLEEQINGVEGMDYMTSSAGNNGAARITVTFKLGTNPDIAAVNVQNRVARASPLLPQEVTRAGVTTNKSQSSNLVIFALYSTNPAYDQTFLQNYAEINLTPQIRRVTGVGTANAFGQMDYAMRIWLRPDVMANYGLVPADISAVLAEQNIEAAPGQFGEQGSGAFQYVIRYTGRLANVTEFENIVVRAPGGGQILRLKDVARVELGALSYVSSTTTNGRPSVGVAISQTAGSNAKEVIEGSLAILDEAAKNFPQGIRYVTLVNADDFLDASIEKVVHTLIEAFVLVFIVVFLFLQDFRSTLIPLIAVPVAIVGTFFFLQLLGFTTNLLTLFALVLAIGIVVDDAIVVVEAVHAKMEEGGYATAREATHAAMAEISGAIISITLVMAAVFIPVSFIAGTAGVFYKQFGLTLAIAIILSAVNALTLSPALCAILLKPHDASKPGKTNMLARFYTWFNRGFERGTQRFRSSVNYLARHKWIAWAGIGLFAALFVILFRTTPSGFVPQEDMSAVMVDITLPPSASTERATAIAAQVEAIARGIPEIENVLRVTGQGLLSGAGTNNAMLVMRLRHWSQRGGKGQDDQSIITQLFAKTSGIRDAKIVFFAQPTLQGFGTSAGFSFQLQDRTGGDIASFFKISSDFLAALGERPEIQYASTSFSPNYPQYTVEVNVAKVKEAGLQVNDVLAALQGYYGGVYASNFNQFGRQFRVIYQSEAAFRATPESLGNIYVRGASGAMAPVTEFINMKRTYGPQSISRFNLYTAISVNGAPNAGYSSGDAIAAIRETAASTLPAGYGYEFSGLTREEIKSGGQTALIFLLIIVFVYLLLSAQYESYLLPLGVLLPLPIGMAGAFAFARMFGLTNNIYLQITLIMLVGLLAKNAILIVEFALERRRHGMPLIEAAVEGAGARLRPIMMTSFAFILGLVPLTIATGASAVGNRSIGTGAVGGMLIGTVLGIFVIPPLFVAFQALQEKISGPPKVPAAIEEANPAVRDEYNSSTPKHDAR